MKKNSLLILPLLLCFSCQKERMTLYLGERIEVKDCDFFSSLNEFYKTDLNTEFSSSRFYMKDFYNQLEKDAVNLTSEHKIRDLLSNTNRILLNVGNYELMRFITATEISLTYDEKIISTSLEMFEYYFHQSLDILTSYTDDIVVLPLYDSLILEESADQDYRQLINRYNEVIEANCREYLIPCARIDKLSRFVYKTNAISQPGMDYLIRQIQECYGSD